MLFKLFEGRTRFNAIVDFRLLQWNLSWSMEKVRRIYIIYGKKLRSVLNFFSIGKVVWLICTGGFVEVWNSFTCFFIFIFADSKKAEASEYYCNAWFLWEPAGVLRCNWICTSNLPLTLSISHSHNGFMYAFGWIWETAHVSWF